MTPERIREMKATFKECDTDGSGDVSRAEFIEGIQNAGRGRHHSVRLADSCCSLQCACHVGLQMHHGPTVLLRHSKHCLYVTYMLSAVHVDAFRCKAGETKLGVESKCSIVNMSV